MCGITTTIFSWILACIPLLSSLMALQTQSAYVLAYMLSSLMHPTKSSIGGSFYVRDTFHGFERPASTLCYQITTEPISASMYLANIEIPNPEEGIPAIIGSSKKQSLFGWINFHQLSQLAL
jgi:hypothetical protein